MVKRLVCALLLVGLMFSVPALCEQETTGDIDLASLSNSELFDLYQDVLSEMCVRGGSSFGILEPGLYEVGKSFKPGTYRFCGVSDENETKVAMWLSVEDREKAGIYGTFSDNNLSDGEQYILTLEEGNVLTIKYNYCLCYMYTEEEKPFWKP